MAGLVVAEGSLGLFYLVQLPGVVLQPHVARDFLFSERIVLVASHKALIPQTLKQKSGNGMLHSALKPNRCNHVANNKSNGWMRRAPHHLAQDEVRHDAAPVRVAEQSVTYLHGVKNHCHAQLEEALDAQGAHLGGVEAHVAELCAEGA
jgi:hypothetical protein